MKSIQIISALTFVGVLILHSSLLTAGTIVEIKNKGEIATILTDGKQARLNSSATDYIIVNYANNSLKIVDTEKRQVTLLNINDIPKGGNSSKMRTAIQGLGSGPAIAGYKTQKFAYSVNGQSCGVIYASKDVYQLHGIKELLNAMKTMIQRQQSMMGGFVRMLDDCILGDIKMTEHMNTIGVPMRTEDKGGIDTEVKSIKLDVVLPADTFVIPASYKTVSVGQKMQKVKKDMTRVQQKMQKYQPQVQQMMQQLQQSGQMPPGVMESLRRAQQYQR